MTGCFAFGDDLWPGVAKLNEECGEVVVEIGKLMMTHGDPDHWSGDLRERLLNEVADVEAAIVFYLRFNMTDEERRCFRKRVSDKFTKFVTWRDEELAKRHPSEKLACAS